MVMVNERKEMQMTNSNSNVSPVSNEIRLHEEVPDLPTGTWIARCHKAQGRDSKKGNRQLVIDWEMESDLDGSNEGFVGHSGTHYLPLLPNTHKDFKTKTQRPLKALYNLAGISPPTALSLDSYEDFQPLFDALRGNCYRISTYVGGNSSFVNFTYPAPQNTAAGADSGDAE